MTGPKRFLFVCSQNRLRSPTAEQVFSKRSDIEVASAGTNNDAETPLSAELVDWADVVVVMEKTHRNKVQRRFRRHLNGKRILCLDIPDDYDFMDDGLIRLLHARMSRHLPPDRPAGHAQAATRRPREGEDRAASTPPPDDPPSQEGAGSPPSRG